jgi:hypothetical protein
VHGGTDRMIHLGDICGEQSFVGDYAVENMYRYSTWIRDEGERILVSKALWEGEMSFNTFLNHGVVPLAVDVCFSVESHFFPFYY